MAILLAGIYGCEKEDTTGVSFLPPQENLQAYQTSLVVMVARQVERERLLGQGGTWRATGILRAGWQSLPGMAIVVDGKDVLAVDERGIATMEGLEAGNHTVSLATIGKIRKIAQKCSHGHHHGNKCEMATAEEIYSLPLKIEKNKMTVLLIDYGSKNRFRFYSEIRAHDFVLERVLRRLTQRALSVEKLIDQFERVLTGSLNYEKWQSLFEKGGQDAEGQIDDWLIAHRFKVDTGQMRSLSLLAALTSFHEKGTTVLLKTVDPRRPPSYHRLRLKSEPTGPGGWKIVSMGLNQPKS